MTVNPEDGSVFLGEVSEMGIYETKLDPKTAAILGRALINGARIADNCRGKLPLFVSLLASVLLCLAVLG
jgi:hypothetical protein